MTQTNDVKFWQKIVAILLAVFVVLSTVAVVLAIKNSNPEKDLKKKTDTTQVDKNSQNDKNTSNIIPSGQRRIVEFGYYPQTEIIDSSVIETLNKQTLEWHSFESQHEYMKYADVSFPNGEKYRAVKLTSQRTDWVTEDELESRPYTETEKVYWFRYESLKWEIIDEKRGLAICTTVIDGQPAKNYDNSGTEQKDYIYGWLNGDFCNTAFTEEDKLKTEIQKVNNNDYRVVLLESHDFFASGMKYGQESNCNYTDYAECMGRITEKDGKTCWWLLNHDGRTFVDTNYLANANDPTFAAGVRPVIYIPGVK